MTTINPNDEWHVDARPAHIATSDDGTCSDPACPCHEWARQEASGLTGMERAGIAAFAAGKNPLWADAATVRAAVLDVIDGDGWFFREAASDQDEQNRERVEFVDRVLTRIAQLQQPPHNAPRLEQRCDSRKRQLLPTHSGVCVDCAEGRLHRNGY